MSNEKFTQSEWYLGNPFRHKDSKSEWCNLYADGEENPIAVVLLNDGCGKTYHNDALMKTAPKMYRFIYFLLESGFLRFSHIPEAEELLMEARGEK